MSTPIHETIGPLSTNRIGSLGSSDEDQTFVGEGSLRDGRRVVWDDPRGSEGERPRETSPSQTREQASRLQDDLAMLRVEQVVDEAASQQENGGRSRDTPPHSEPADDFDITTKRSAVYKPPENPSTNLAKLFKRVHDSSFLVRYCFYITPLVVLILIPLLLGSLLFKQATVGGVKLYWFSIWLEIVWLTLWAGRVSFQWRGLAVLLCV